MYRQEATLQHLPMFALLRVLTTALGLFQRALGELARRTCPVRVVDGRVVPARSRLSLREQEHVLEALELSEELWTCLEYVSGQGPPVSGVEVGSARTPGT